jgi:gluconate 2-dehydrogenase gamma chain
LSPAQREILEAFANRLMPRDEYGPSATEAGAVDYIDRSLSDYLAGEKTLLVAGLEAVDAFAQQQYKSSLAQLSSRQQDEMLAAMESNAVPGFKPDSHTFFLRLRQLTMEGMFGDPSYGGNRAFAGWDLIRYPGPRLAVSPEDQMIRTEIKPLRVSAYGPDHNH